MEAELIYTEPPSYPRPVVEGFAATAMALGDLATAEKMYREALTREPGSGRAYLGLAAALRGLNRQAEAQEMTLQGLKAWNNADADLPQLHPTRSTASSQK